jgi:LPXTG-motif cell wall-anchored protein
MAARSVTATAPGKINVCMRVGPLREDGYHDVATIYQAVSLLEEITATEADDISVSFSGPIDTSGIALGESNLVVRAARAVAAEAGADFGTLNTWERIVDFGSFHETNNIVISRHADTGQLLLEVWNSGSAYGRLVTLDSSIVENEVAHWVVSMESDGTAHMFKNGVELVTNINGVNYDAGAPYSVLPETVVRNHGYVGRSLWGDPEFGGSMTYLRVYERALTPDEITANIACDDATDAACAAAQSGGSNGGSELASTGFDTTLPALAGLATLALGVAIRRRRSA